MKNIFYVIIFFSNSLYSQIKHIGFGANYLMGDVFIHTPKINIHNIGTTHAFEFSYKKQTNGNKNWEQLFGFPEIALNTCFAYNGTSTLGYSIGVYPSIQFHFLKQKKLHGFLKIGSGIGIVTRHWKRLPYNDTLNNIIGGVVNNFTQFQLGIKYPIHKNCVLQLGFHFYHTSNASARLPNYGINTYGGFLGMSFFPKGIKTKFEKRVLGKHKNYFNFGIKSCFAVAENKIPDGPLYRFYSQSLLATKMYKNKNQLFTGIDATYYSKLYANYKNNQHFVGKEWQHAWRLSAFIGHEFLFGKIGFPIQAGFYSSRKVIGGPMWYQKLGMNYYFFSNQKTLLKNIFISTQLKTHLLQAEFAEVGLGILF